jgi:hypothetical protein
MPEGNNIINCGYNIITCVYNLITDANSIIICQYNWIRCTCTHSHTYITHTYANLLTFFDISLLKDIIWTSF